VTKYVLNAGNEVETPTHAHCQGAKVAPSVWVIGAGSRSIDHPGKRAPSSKPPNKGQGPHREPKGSCKNNFPF